MQWGAPIATPAVSNFGRCFAHNHLCFVCVWY